MLLMRAFFPQSRACLWQWEQHSIELNECETSLAMLVQPPVTGTARDWGLKG